MRLTNFILRMMWREARGAYRRLFFFLSSIALGVGAIVGVGIMATNFEAMTHHETRNLLAADLEARLNRPLSEAGEAVLMALAHEGVAFVHVTELKGMAASVGSGETQLVELKAVEAGYPFYGRLVIEPRPSHPVLDPEGIWAERGLLLRLHLNVGDRVRIGEASFLIRGEILKEPDHVVGPFRLGPRVLLSQEGLERTELVRTGSRIRHRFLFKTGPAWTPEQLKGLIGKRWPDESVRLRTYREVQPRLSRFLENFTTYLGLVGPR